MCAHPYVFFHILGSLPESQVGPNAIVLSYLLLFIKEKEGEELWQTNAIRGRSVSCVFHPHSLCLPRWCF